MSKIYDALENARKEGAKIAESVSSPTVALPVYSEQSPVDIDMEQEMVTLYQMITVSLPDIDHPSILFIGSCSNEGASTVAQELAKMVSLRLGKTVLLIDFDRSHPAHHIYANIQPEKHLETAETGDLIKNTLCRVEDSSLYVMPLFLKTMATTRTIDSARGYGFWEPLKERFDLIIVDSPPGTMFPDGAGLASQVDGVILVVEAEKTRWQIVLSVKEKIIKSGGNLLGVVFNKRRLHIPQWLYNRL
ncbi:MAG: CpsD/CapB family tyrosine-protein kinase [Syntrophobacterales bacterium]|jgi:Mrp family chromosome partitioning ATPase|nr:CpsD/CapB family tyrosine-protein kinase [Syntrophobacterales bacterium]